MPSEDGGRDLSDASISHRMPRTASRHKRVGKRQETGFPQRRRSQPCKGSLWFTWHPARHRDAAFPASGRRGSQRPSPRPSAGAPSCQQPSEMNMQPDCAVSSLPADGFTPHSPPFPSCPLSGEEGEDARVLTPGHQQALRTTCGNPPSAAPRNHISISKPAASPH